MKVAVVLTKKAAIKSADYTFCNHVQPCPTHIEKTMFCTKCFRLTALWMKKSAGMSIALIG